MSWNETNFERHLNERLVAEFGADRATSMYSRYVAARDKVLNDIRQIQGVEPNLSDHGPDHLANVMENAYSLISGNHEEHGLSATDLYVLALVIVFHDVGNLFGRENHHVNIGKVFDWARGAAAEVRRERTLVIKAAQAHTGTNNEGSRNTLIAVDPADHLEGRQVQLRHIAAVLRFADELAEGPQRTTDFYRTHIGYDPDAAMFHQYAACTHVSADRANERIRLTFEILLDDFQGSQPEKTNALATLLTFILHRISKLDEERRYARFYCPILLSFKQTDVVINFTHGGTLLPVDVRFQLDDLVVPGEHVSTFEERFPGKCKAPAGIAQDVYAIVENGGHDQ
ncbi:MAG: hypothetical protein RIC55_27505 [Pirellulaceae bacterium]